MSEVCLRNIQLVRARVFLCVPVLIRLCVYVHLTFYEFPQQVFSFYLPSSNSCNIFLPPSPRTHRPLPSPPCLFVSLPCLSSSLPCLVSSLPCLLSSHLLLTIASILSIRTWKFISPIDSLHSPPLTPNTLLILQVMSWYQNGLSQVSLSCMFTFVFLSQFSLNILFWNIILLRLYLRSFRPVVPSSAAWKWIYPVLPSMCLTC